MEDLKVFRWLLDVDPIWPVPIGGSKSAQSTAHWATIRATSHALALLTDGERAKALRFYRPSDAKLSLGSNLLKHRAIANTCQVPWSQAVISEGANKKPCYKTVAPSSKSLEFNVSHHGSLVALVGCPREDVRLGVDVVRMNWDKDYNTVMKDGFEAWANVYESVFSKREIQDIAGFVPPTRGTQQDEIRAKLRHFYAHWCLKEAYIKMTGEALLAPWLKDLEFCNVQVPLPASRMNASGQSGSDWGQTCADVEIWLYGKRVTHVRLEIQAFREDYMIATASSSLEVAFSAFKELDVERDVYPFQEG
ncbi:MAG: hypothetical protein ASARMPREDX12_001908 [Alectoria sarmentosa]|nr:MAG: hypothetical protein ASARMPREDX12_001908 [Alectoria sarmentosa]